MKSNSFICVWCVVNIVSVISLNIFTPIVHINQGRLRGLRSLIGQNRYYGIPYAVSERFQPPKKPPKWKGMFNAVKRFNSCAQTVSFFKFGTEHCLELDVYTPGDAKIGQRLPVLIYIHGGGYYYGSKWQYDPEFLVAKKIVAVVINYRVGVCGFLCINGVANLGLKDQVAALEWVKENIAAFGGDPDNVTISGQSAGASSAAMHLLSKSSKGLFHKAILISGHALTPWAFNVDPLRSALQDAEKLARVTNVKNAFEVFQNASINDLLDNCRDTSINNRGFKYAPCVDSNFSEHFFHDTPYNIISSGDFNKVPIIEGYVDVEGILFYGLNDEESLEKLNSDFIDRIPALFSTNDENVKEGIVKKFREHYFHNKRITKDLTREIIRFYSDWLIYSTTDAFTNLMSKYSDEPVFKYMFSYEGERNFAKFLFGPAGIDGACHSDDVFYIFKPAGLPLPISSEDRLFINRWTTMLTNFMKFGDPTPQTTKLLPVRWPRTTTNNSVVMRLDHQLWVSETPASHKGEFFLDLLCKYGMKGFVPCEP